MVVCSKNKIYYKTSTDFLLKKNYRKFFLSVLLKVTKLVEINSLRSIRGGRTYITFAKDTPFNVFCVPQNINKSILNVRICVFITFYTKYTIGHVAELGTPCCKKSLHARGLK